MDCRVCGTARTPDGTLQHNSRFWSRAATLKELTDGAQQCVWCRVLYKIITTSVPQLHWYADGLLDWGSDFFSPVWSSRYNLFPIRLEIFRTPGQFHAGDGSSQVAANLC
jgi:hypothetical protein